MSEVLILTVTGVETEIEKTFPPALVIKAKGESTVAGVYNAKLNPYYYFAPPQDGIYEFALVVSEPDYNAEYILTPVEVQTFVWHNFPEDLKGIRVYAATNSIEEVLFQEAETSELY
jgi:hypothetical protein